MKVLYYGDSIRHFENELAFDKFVGQGYSSDQSSTNDNELDQKLFIGIGLLILMGAVGFYYYNLKKQREKLLQVPGSKS